jgi:molybdopterin/thiamine biosynthesis adenylyltransferase
LGEPASEVLEDLYPELRESFRRALTAAGFTRDERKDGREIWSGSVSAAWTDPGTSDEKQATHKVAVELRAGFPFLKPSAWAIDDGGNLPKSRHIVGTLCLYPETYEPGTQRGWAQWRTGEEFLSRIRELFERAYRDDWDSENRPADLHLSFPFASPIAMMLIGDDWHPPAGATSGRFGVWRKNGDVAFAGSPGAGQVGLPDNHGDRILSAMSFDKEPPATGAWIRLPREPAPRKTLGGLLAEIDRVTARAEGWALDQCRQLIGGGRRSSTAPVLALGYPDAAVGGEAWLFIEIGRNPDDSQPKWNKPATTAHTKITAFETASVSHDALMRRTGPVAKAVSGKRVVIFGLGALGSAAAMLLAKSGVQYMRFVESDRIRPGNAVRHVAPVRATGFDKAIFTAFEIRAHVPDCKIEQKPETWDPDKLATLVGDADVVLDTTANEPFSFLLNEVAMRAGKTVVYSGAMRRAAVGRIRVVRPGRDACLACYETHVTRGKYPVVPPGEGEEFFEEGCGVPTVEAAAVDVEVIANWAARAVLWELRDALGPRNHCLVVNDVIPEAAGDLAEIGVHWSVFAPIAGCVVCAVSGSATSKADAVS